MPTGDLRKTLGKSKIETQRRLQQLENDHAKTNENFKHWNKALQAFARGWSRPKPFFPVIISPDSPVSTPQKLQDVAGLSTIPRVLDTIYTTLKGRPDDAHLRADGKPEEVQVGLISWRELVAVTSKAECEDFLFVFVDGKVRHAIMVKEIKASTNEGKQEALAELKEATEA